MKQDIPGRRKFGADSAKKPEDKKPVFARGGQPPAVETESKPAAAEAAPIPIGRGAAAGPVVKPPALTIARTPAETTAKPKKNAPADSNTPRESQVATVVPGDTQEDEPSLATAWDDEGLPAPVGHDDGAVIIADMAAHPPGAARPPQTTQEVDDGDLLRSVEDGPTPGPEPADIGGDPVQDGRTIQDKRIEPEDDILSSADVGVVDDELGKRGPAPEAGGAASGPKVDGSGPKAKGPSDEHEKPHRWIIAIGALLFTGGVLIGHYTKREKIVRVPANCDTCPAKQVPAPKAEVVELPKAEAPAVAAVEPAPVVETVTVGKKGKQHAAPKTDGAKKSTGGCSSLKDADGAATAGQVPTDIWRAARIGVDTLQGQLTGTVQVTYLLCPNPNGEKGVTAHLIGVKGAGPLTTQVEANVRSQFDGLKGNDSGISTVKVVREDVPHE